ncbi:MAG: hypothetical protein WAN59_08400 [Candidatus Baltobacteraceae bacterium]
MTSWWLPSPRPARVAEGTWMVYPAQRSVGSAKAVTMSLRGLP